MKRILIIHTGGTFGMIPLKPSQTLAPGDIHDQLRRHVPELEGIARIETLIPFNIDSGNMTLDHWKLLAERIARERSRFDGFVIIHGTDTMAYTATALSFSLLHFGKPVILTGSQRPLVKIRTDARSNLINAVEIAASGIPEVGIFFGTQLFRGNRATKVSAFRYDAFMSPNFPPLAEVGVDILLQETAPPPRGRFSLFTAWDPSVIVIKLFPGLPASFLDHLLDSPVRGIILEAYGAGNVPIGAGSLLPFIRKATEGGKLVAIGTQCLHGKVSPELYECGRRSEESGAQSCGDMTAEASVVKLMYLLGRFRDVSEVRRWFNLDVAGERSADAPATGEAFMAPDPESRLP